ncbi:hypothetical protein ACF1GT_11815 [Streptomyces sp. NPDC014636]|uniref:hypothetical protein n=1 Tax=Streptomyces sp. NPDC014636 TaxID=3364876 RepID=UPI0036FD148A
MSDTATVTTSIIAMLGTMSVALVSMKQAKATADSAVQQARESAGGPVYESSTQRNAEFQKQRRLLYGETLEALVNYSLCGEGEEGARRMSKGELLRTVRKAQIVAHDTLREKLNHLADNPDTFDACAVNALARAMSEDARKDG